MQIRGFGSFFLKKYAAKKGRNIKKNLEVEIPEHFKPVFKPSKEFKVSIKNSKYSLKRQNQVNDAE